MFSKLFGYAKGILNIVTISELVISIISLMTGLIFFTSSSTSTVTLGILTGIIFILFGIINIYSFIKRNSISLYNYNFIFGIILLVNGLFALILNNYLTIIISIYLIITGVQKIIYGILLKKYNESSWLLILVIGILFIALGIVTFFTNRDATITVTGINLIGYGLINVLFLMLLRKRSEYFIA